MATAKKAAKKATAKKSAAKKGTKKEVLHVCVDRPVTLLNATRSMLHSINHNAENNPALRGSREHDLVMRFTSDPHHSFNPNEAATLARMAIVTASKWQKGTTITIAFLDGTATQKRKVKKMAAKWLPLIDLKFKYLRSKNAMIRISFNSDPGSWSYIGTQCLSIPTNEPTMNFGWLRDSTPDAEWERVVVHEFGHALGCIHEHQNPAGGINWNKPAVYKYYEGPPNNWTKAEVDNNLFRKYAANQTQFTAVDRNSIMMYPIPKEFLLSGDPVGWNLHLSQTDKTFISETYPKGRGAAKSRGAGAARSMAAAGNTTLDSVYIVDSSDNSISLEVNVGDQGQTSLMTIRIDNTVIAQNQSGDFPETQIGTNAQLNGRTLKIAATITDTSQATNLTFLTIRLRGGLVPKDFPLQESVETDGASVDYICLIRFFEPI